MHRYKKSHQYNKEPSNSLMSILSRHISQSEHKLHASKSSSLIQHVQPLDHLTFPRRID